MPRRAIPQSVDLIHPLRAKPFRRDGWIYEGKYDGWRIVGFRMATEFASSAATAATICDALDGEVAIFDQQLRSRFDWPPRQP